MPSQKIISRFPDFYKSFLPRFFENDNPGETARSCSDCSMMNSDSSMPGIISFSPHTKCCTYYPNLPNYMVGALLSDRNPELNQGRIRIRSLIRKGVAVKPHGIMRPDKFQLLIKSSVDLFGRATSLVCPCFDSKNGTCTLWPFHSSVCNTWFCKYSAGEDGRLFWNSLRNYLIHVENVLELYTLQKTGFEAAEMIVQQKDVHLISALELDDKKPDKKTYQRMWGKWAGREEEFYKETYRIVKGLNRPRFKRISGIAGEVLLRDVMKKLQKIVKPKPPAFLKRNPHLVVEKTGEDEYTLISYSRFDPITVSGRIYRIIDFFDGAKDIRATGNEILKKTKTEPSPDLLLSLYQMRVLIENNPG